MELANHGLILLQQLNAQREFGFLCDCTVAIGDVFFKAHKAVLAAFSNYFRMLFIHQDRYRRTVLIAVLDPSSVLCTTFCCHITEFTPQQLLQPKPAVTMPKHTDLLSCCQTLKDFILCSRALDCM